MAKIAPGLIWLASYPKSGNTWMRILLANLLSGAARPADINNLSEPENLTSRWRFADDMLVDSDLLDETELTAMRPAHCDFVAEECTTAFFCKTHDRFWLSHDQPTLGTMARKALYILRDPRDVAVSLSHHASLSIDGAIAQMMDPATRSSGTVQLPYRVGDWAGHVTGWTQQRVIETMIVRYESMHADTVGTLRAIVDFLGGDATEQALRQAVTNSSFQELQRQESRKGFRESRPGQQRFFRAGRAGGWRDVLTDRQAGVIEETFGAVMAANGYAVPG
ncbi:MAG: sulfotransferase domain-containing protein [Tsuneonella sp.]